MKNKPKKCWSKSIGERELGNVVRVYEARPGGTLMRSIYINGKEDRKSLGHRDQELAKEQARALSAQLRKEEKAIAQETLTLGLLMRLYVESPAHMDKKERTQKEDIQRLKRVVTFWGAGRRVETLTDSDVRRFISARRRGDTGLIGVVPGRKVRDRSVEADLVAVHTMLNWGAKERDRYARRLISENPLHGTPIPREKNPVRPLVTYDEYLKLLDVAGQVNPLLRLALIVTEGTGRRLSAFRQLRWSDINLEAGTINWRAAYDKKGYAGVVPIAEEVRQALADAQRESGTIGDVPVFPSPEDPRQPCGRRLLHGWLELAYGVAELEPKSGGMWHPFRRKWATERKGLSPVDVAQVGGWKNPNTPIRIYQQADMATMREVVASPTHRLASGA